MANMPSRLAAKDSAFRLRSMTSLSSPTVQSRYLRYAPATFLWFGQPPTAPSLEASSRRRPGRAIVSSGPPPPCQHRSSRTPSFAVLQECPRSECPPQTPPQLGGVVALLFFIAHINLQHDGDTASITICETVSNGPVCVRCHSAIETS